MGWKKAAEELDNLVIGSWLMCQFITGDIHKMKGMPKQLKLIIRSGENVNYLIFEDKSILLVSNILVRPATAEEVKAYLLKTMFQPNRQKRK